MRRSRRPRRMALDPERKFADTAVSTAVSQGGFRAILNGVPQGNTQNNREGFQQLNVSSLIRYTLNLVGTDAAVMRVSLVLFKQPAGIDLNVNTVYGNVGTDFAAISSRLLTNAFGLKVLWSRTHRLDLGDQNKVSTVFKKFRIITRYDLSGNGGIANIGTGALYLLVHSDIADGNPLPVINFISRIRFVG